MLWFGWLLKTTLPLAEMTSSGLTLFSSNNWDGILSWVSFAKLIYSQTISVKEKDYIEAARAMGNRMVQPSAHFMRNISFNLYFST